MDSDGAGVAVHLSKLDPMEVKTEKVYSLAQYHSQKSIQH